MGNCCSRVGAGSFRYQEKEEHGPGNSSTQKKSHLNANSLLPTLVPSGKTAHGGHVLDRPMEDIKLVFNFGKELGRGQFGITHLCTRKFNNEQFACKTIAKNKLIQKEDIEDVRREVQIMHHLAGKPNIVELKGAYEDKDSVHLVMELCAGGELFDRIIAKGHYSEQAAASLLRTIVQIVYTCHSAGVIHRDLKPENFLLLNSDDNSALKATDFGLSVFYKQGDKFRDVVGSAYYIAPEVLKRCYGPEADIWSVGVILFILLTGIPPFWADTESGIFKAILEGKINFESDPWPSISDSAKDLVKKMLTSDPKRRITAIEVLDHPWIKEDGDAPDIPLDNAVITRLKQFKAMNKLKKVALRFIASCLSEEDIKGLQEMFKGIDTDNSSTLTFDELRNGLQGLGVKLTETELAQIMKAMDVDNNGTIDYREFVAATMQFNRIDKDGHLLNAFQHFDKDKSGSITIEELEEALREFGVFCEVDIKEILMEVDSDNDGRISYQEFVEMMRRGNPQVNLKKRREDDVDSASLFCNPGHH